MLVMTPQRAACAQSRNDDEVLKPRCNECTDPTMCSGHQHTEQKDASYRAETNAANGGDDLQNGTELLDGNAAKDTMDAGEEDEQLHNQVCPVLRVVDVRLDVVKVDDATQ